MMLIGASFITALTVYGSMFPVGIPLFSSANLTFSTIVFFYLLRKRQIVVGKWILAYMAVAFVYLFPLCFTSNLYAPNLFDIYNIINFFVFFNVLYCILYEIKDFDSYMAYCQFFFTAGAILFAVFGLIKFWLLLNGTMIPHLYRSEGTYPWGTSLISDYNVFGLGLLLGLISTYFSLQRCQYLSARFALITCGIFITLCIAFSGSRRSWIVLLFYAAIFIASKIPETAAMVLNLEIRKTHFNAVILLFVSVWTIIFVVNFLPLNLQVAQKNYLVSMKNRFVSIIDHLSGDRQIGDRIDILAHAGMIFENYGYMKTVFGNGGEYMIELGERPEANDKFGKPHNVIVSSLLHSGMPGGILAVLMLTISIILYVSQLSHPKLVYFFNLFLITSFFSLTSTNTLFTKKIFIFLLFLPWVIAAIDFRNGDRR
jgi:hypothetical protein